MCQCEYIKRRGEKEELLYGIRVHMYVFVQFVELDTPMSDTLQEIMEPNDGRVSGSFLQSSWIL